MRRWTRLACGLALAALATTAAPADAGADALALELADVAVDGDSGWRAVNQFTVHWNLVRKSSSATGAAPIEPTAVEYRLRDERGTALGEAHLATPIDHYAHVSIPASPGQERPLPGAYRLAVRLRTDSLAGPEHSVVLRFDDGRPTAIRPHVAAGWLRAGTSTELTLEHPGQPRPLSGIRGYAIELDRGAGGEPCGGSLICADAEIDLPGGEADDSIVLGPLAEGVGAVRAVAVSGTGVRSAVAETAVLRVDGTPPAIAIAGAPSAWSNHPLELTAVASDPLSGMAAAGPSGPITAIAVDGATAAVSQGSRATATVHGDGAHLVTAYGRDAVGNLGAADPGAARRTVWIDETAPRVAFVAERDPDQPEQIVAAVADGLSGPSTRQGSIAIRPAGGNLPFEPLPTRVLGDRLVAVWNSDAYPRGEYAFRATAFDGAGNRAASGRREDGGAMVLSNPVKVPTALALAFGGRRFVAHTCRRGKRGLRCHNHVVAALAERPPATTVGYGRRVPVTGTLTDAGGAPLAGRQVAITETFAAGSEPRQRTTATTTGNDGVFLVRLAPGPSRRIAVAFAGTPTLTAAAGPELGLAVRAAIRLRASAATAAVGGAPVVFSGHLGRRSATVPADGVPIALEFRVAGLPWSEFRTVRTDARGAFRFPYGFSDDDSRGVRFQFRAYVATQPSWPYDAAYSRPVAVTGR